MAHFTKPAKRASVVHRQAPKYADNCHGQTPGYWKGQGNVDWAGHHILCVSCFGLIDAGGDADKQQYVEDCLCITPWNVNDKPNMVGLPMKGKYEKTNGATPTDLPAHDVDHNSTNGYTDEATKYLNDNVWQVLNDRRKKHENNAKAIKQALEDASDHFRGALIDRGTRGSGSITGTKDCWEARRPKPPKSWSAARKAAYKQCKKWYAPFSMADVPNPRSPGVDWGDLTGIFEMLKVP